MIKKNYLSFWKEQTKDCFFFKPCKQPFSVTENQRYKNLHFWQIFEYCKKYIGSCGEVLSRSPFLLIFNVFHREWTLFVQNTLGQIFYYKSVFHKIGPTHRPLPSKSGYIPAPNNLNYTCFKKKLSKIWEILFFSFIFIIC